MLGAPLVATGLDMAHRQILLAVAFGSAFCARLHAHEATYFAGDRPSRTIAASLAWVELLNLRIAAADQEKRGDGPSVQNETQKFRVTYYGELAAADEPAYVAIREVVAAREGPGTRWPSRFSLEKGKVVTALGKFIDKRGSVSTLVLASKGVSIDQRDREWIKFRTDDGNEGFAPLRDLLTPKQYEERLKRISRGTALVELFSRAERSSGELAHAAGVYTYGKSCINLDSQISMALSTRWLQWSEGNTYYSANVMNPENVRSYRIEPEKIVTLNTVRSVKFYRIIPLSSQAPVDVIGFKGNNGYYRGDNPNQYGILTKCNSTSSEKQHVMKELWPLWIESPP
jgi:hypothetical protein